MIGQTLGHYRIVEKIGAGGMGEVYRARDEHLGRDAALKVLPAGTLADEHARSRFRKEAEALSKLNHPHICTVHDFDTQDGVDFLVMELVEGTALSDQLAAGPLAEKEVARLGSQVAEALEEAHEQGVVHRDLKPGNVMVTPKGQVKVLDFGLAKLLRPVSATATTESFTETQGAAGTLPYMAPEQLRGSVADHRSDIYSFGAVLYEMATGQRPFQERLATALVDDIMHKPPPLPGRLKPDLSPRLEEIILKCLEKEPENRYQSAKELLVDLRRLSSPTVAAFTPSPQAPAWGKPVWRLAAAGFAVVALLAVLVGLNVGGLRQRLLRGATPPPGKIMLAVLPFDNLSADPEQEYFSDGMTEEMIAELGQLQPQRLGVIARTSAMHYKGTDKRIDEIGRELGVDYILEGSVRRAAGRVRITAQLIQVSDQTHLWAESYERELADIFAIQSDVAQRIARSLEVELLPAQQARLASARPVNPEAYGAYLKGRFHWNKRTEEEVRKGIEYFQQAIEKDPNYALAYAGLADSYNILGDYSYVPPEEAYPRAKVAAAKALETDDTLAEAHTSLAKAAHLYDWNWLAAERGFQRALALNPSYAPAHHWYAEYLAAMGRVDEAIAEKKRARELDPLSLIINSSEGWVLYFARRYDQAIEQLQKALEMDPNFAVAHLWLGWAYEQKGMYEEAIREFQKAVTLFKGSTYPIASLGHAYAVSGKRGEALKLLNELKELSKRRYVSAYDLALVYAGLGEKDQAFKWLEKAYEERYGWITMLKLEPRFDPLRADPRFQSLLRRMNFPER
jgi:serine/threonine-protein kinase